MPRKEPLDRAARLKLALLNLRAAYKLHEEGDTERIGKYIKNAARDVRDVLVDIENEKAIISDRNREIL